MFLSDLRDFQKFSIKSIVYSQKSLKSRKNSLKNDFRLVIYNFSIKLQHFHYIQHF